MKLTTDWIEKLAAALDVPVSDIFAPPVWRERIEMDGYLKGGFVFHPVRGSSARYWIDTEDADDEASFWVGLADNALAPYYFQGDVLRFTGYLEDAFAMMGGRLGCMTLDDGRTVLAIVDTYLGNGRFDLRAVNGQRLDDVQVEQFTILTGAKIREPSLIQKKLAE